MNDGFHHPRPEPVNPEPSYPFVAVQREYIVVQSHIVGNLEHYEFTYSSDGIRNPTYDEAVAHGLEATGHDDWWIAEVEGRRLVALAWMHEDQRDPEEFAGVAEALDLEYRP